MTSRLDTSRSRHGDRQEVVRGIADPKDILDADALTSRLTAPSPRKNGS